MRLPLQPARGTLIALLAAVAILALALHQAAAAHWTHHDCGHAVSAVDGVHLHAETYNGEDGAAWSADPGCCEAACCATVPLAAPEILLPPSRSQEPEKLAARPGHEPEGPRRPPRRAA